MTSIPGQTMSSKSSRGTDIITVSWVTTGSIASDVPHPSERARTDTATFGNPCHSLQRRYRSGAKRRGSKQMTSNRTRQVRPPGADASRSSAELDRIVTVLGDATNRRVIRYLQRNDGIAFRDAIVADLVASGRADRERIAIALHHSVLPRLDDCDVVEYERETGLVIFQGDPLVVALLETLDRCERPERP